MQNSSQNNARENQNLNMRFWEMAVDFARMQEVNQLEKNIGIAPYFPNAILKHTPMLLRPWL